MCFLVMDKCVQHINNTDSAQICSYVSRASMKSQHRVKSFRTLLKRGSSFLDTISMKSLKSRRSETSLNISRMS